MEVARVLRMKAGSDDSSYATNCSMQKLIASLTAAERRELAVELYRGSLPERMAIADLGCATGPNALLMASDAVQAVASECRIIGRPPPEFQVFLNDLPTNDFNSVFRQLTADRNEAGGVFPFFVAAVPGSFYGRLFPARSLNFVVSSSSLHWLSQVPAALKDGSANPRHIHFAAGSPASVPEAYKAEFQKDFFMFLRSRSLEITAGGLLILTFMARRCQDPTADTYCFTLDLLARALMDMVADGLVEEEKVNTFNVPYYAPSLEELRQDVAAEGSFSIARHKLFEANWYDVVDSHHADTEGKSLHQQAAKQTAKAHRAVLESMLATHFGEAVLDELFRRYTVLLEERYRRQGAKITSILIALEKK